MSYFDELYNAIQDPVILHYIVYPKPWLKEYSLPYKCEWMKYQNRTKWAGMKQKHMKNWLTYLFKKRFVICWVNLFILFVKICQNISRNPPN